MKAPEFNAILEGNLEDLVGWTGGVAAASLETFYAKAMVSFLRGDVDDLRSLETAVFDLFLDHPERAQLQIALRLRLQIRRRVFDSADLRKASELAGAGTRWTGELLILLATAHTIFNSWERAGGLFAQAAAAFEAQGCLRKALRARLNVLVSESHLHPEKNLFARYHDLYRQALRRDRREMIVATTCLLNISREYETVGSYLAALKYCNRAVALFERQMGELNYFLTLAHRAHLLLQLGRPAEARIDFETARLCSFPEVHAALETLEARLAGVSSQGAHAEHLLPTWRERTETAPPARLSELEEKLVRFLAVRPRERIDVLEHLYGDRLDYEVKQNRLKSLLVTLRKKSPGLVVSQEGKLRLTESIALLALKPRTGT